MELNITKENVFSCEKAYNQNVEQGIDFTLNIPDYCGVVQRILKYSIIPRVSSKTINGQTLTIEGTACFNIIYLDEENCVSSYEYNAPFQKSIDIGLSSADVLKINVNARCSYINAKAITPSRIDVHSVIELSICIIKKKKQEIVCDIDCSDVFVSRGEAPATVPINSAEKNMIIEEELILESDMPSINCIIRQDATINFLGSKIVNDKVVAKGELKVNILYCAENRSTRQKFTTTVPFSQIVDVEGLNEECKCDVSAEILTLEIKPRNAHDGECRSFMLNSKLCINVQASCNNDIAVIYDAYSKKYNVNLSCCDTTFEKVINNISELFVCKKNIEFSDGDIHNIIDLWCISALGGYRIEDNNVIISGSVTVCLIAENSDGVINYFERPIDFEYRFDAEVLPQGVRIEPTINALNSSYSVIGDNSLEVKIELSVTAAIFEIKTLNIAAEIDLTKNEKCDLSDNCAMIIYYAEKGEKIWDIAKRFYASPDDIMKINSVEKEITDNIPLLISC